MDYQDFRYAFLKYIQSNLGYQILNMIRLVIQILHSMLQQIFSICYYSMSVLRFFMYSRY